MFFLCELWSSCRRLDWKDAQLAPGLVSLPQFATPPVCCHYLGKGGSNPYLKSFRKMVITWNLARLYYALEQLSLKMNIRNAKTCDFCMLVCFALMYALLSCFTHVCFHLISNVQIVINQNSDSSVRKMA